MRLELIVFFIILAIFLYWKFGGKFALPQMGGVGTKLGGALSGAFAQASGDNKHRIEFIFLFVLVLIGLWATKPAVYSWLWEHGRLTVFISFIIIGYIVRPPKSKFFLKMGVLALLSMGIYSSIPEEKMGWTRTVTTTTVPEAPAMTVTKNAKQERTVRSIRLVSGTQGFFTEIEIPKGVTFKLYPQEGCLVGVIHDGIPEGIVFDCTEPLELGSNVRNLRLGFSSKTDVPIEVVVELTPL